jgi:hypothetical protein
MFATNDSTTLRFVRCTLTLRSSEGRVISLLVELPSDDQALSEELLALYSVPNQKKLDRMAAQLLHLAWEAMPVDAHDLTGGREQDAFFRITTRSSRAQSSQRRPVRVVRVKLDLYRTLFKSKSLQLQPVLLLSSTRERGGP